MHEGDTQERPTFTLPSINWETEATPPHQFTLGEKNMALWLNLLDAFAFLGMAGTVLAVGAALTAAIAFTFLGSPAGGGMATAGWLICLALSVFSGLVIGNWVMPADAVGALPLSLLLGRALGLVGLLRPALRTGQPEGASGRA
ncbi:hypothetical protein [Microbacterium sp. W4I20]|uniref:hypothetical protein n=1 Tax=Microbacterium sp. W4I20 TaxID=3042262 RepID=UPI00278377C4|nr:hypothetical protein [Microbacterium sp. W4I20]MDQ0729176.1 hypothetical protein [Microbacterium sp. W4I20]